MQRFHLPWNRQRPEVNLKLLVFLAQFDIRAGDIRVEAQHRVVPEFGHSHTAVCSYDIVGDWAIERIVAGDTLSLTPVKTDSGLPQTITFGEDGNYGVKTNCNSLGGSYTYTGDSLRFGDSFSTLMACTDMQAEMLLGRILPEVTVPERASACKRLP